MTDKLVLTDLANLQNETTAVNAINANNAATIAALNVTLSRNGTFPNQMQAPLDMNSHQIINLPSPTSNTSPIRVADLNGGTASISPMPSGGTFGQVLTKVSSANFDAQWKTAYTINVKTFGAVGDGVTDDTDAIQNALNDTSVGCLLFPKGTYLINAGGLTGVSNKMWQGEGVGVTIIRISAAPTLDFIYFNGKTNFGFDGITFDGNDKLTNLGGGHYPNLLPCIHISGCNRFFVRNCEFIKFTTIGFLANVSNTMSIEHNIVTRTTASTGAGMTAGNFGIGISGTGTIDASNAYDFVIDGNVCTNCQISVSGHDGAIVNNVISGWGFSAGINTQSLASNHSLYIAGNKCFNSNQAVDSPGGYFPAGIENWARNSVITGNICYGNYGSGIDNGASDTVIANNNCYNNGNGGAGAGGITLYGQDATFKASNCIIEGNRCTDTRAGGAKTQAYGLFEHTGIATFSATGNVIGVNHFEGNLTNKMFLQTMLRPSSMASLVTIPTDFGFSGGIHQAVSSFSLNNGGFQHFITPSGSLTANRTLAIAMNDGNRTLSMNGDITFGGQFFISGASALTINTSGTTNLTIPAGTSTMVTTASNLGVFAATTSAQLASVISDETGTGALVFGTNPAISGGSHQNLTSLSFLNSGFQHFVASGGTLTANRTLTVNNQDGDRTLTLSGNINIAGGFATVGAFGTTLTMTNTTALTLPTAGTLATLAGTESLTNKTISGATNSVSLSAHAAQAAWTLVVNNTSGSASPTAVDIPTFTTKASPAAGDFILISDQAASGALKKATVSSIASAGSVSSIAGNTGAFTLANGITNNVNSIELTAARRTLPTTQTFTSSSGTYTTPANVLWIEVEMVGAGGGGAPSGTVSVAAGAGGNTTFSTFTASGGGAGTQTAISGAGGAAAGGDVNIPGSTGTSSGGLTSFPGGSGGTSFFGGAGGGTYGATGGAASTNSGSGGGGAGSSAAVTGGGGGSGGFVRKTITSPSATYSYGVGTGGAGSVSGSAFNGGGGSNGIIIVREHYGS